MECRELYRHKAELQAYDSNPHPKAFNDLSGANFRRFTALWLTVHSHLTLCDQDFPAPATLRHASKFEEVTEFNVLALKREFDGLHKDFQIYRFATVRRRNYSVNHTVVRD